MLNPNDKEIKPMKSIHSLPVTLLLVSGLTCSFLFDSSITGYVKVDDSDKSICGAKVYLVHMGDSPESSGGFLSTTDSDGYYWMNQIMMNGKLEMIVKKDGFEEERDTLELDNGKDYDRDFYLSTTLNADSLRECE